MPQQDPMVRTALLAERRSIRKQLEDVRQLNAAVPKVRLELRSAAERMLDHKRAHLLAQLGAIDEQLKR